MTINAKNYWPLGSTVQKSKTDLSIIACLAKDIIDNKTDFSNPNNRFLHGWNIDTINTLSELSFLSVGHSSSGYQSFYHPINQLKGIGVCFDETDPNDIAFPQIFFTNDNKTNSLTHLNFIDIIKALGL